MCDSNEHPSFGEFPDFDDLYGRSDGRPDGASWGVFDRGDTKDQKGTLNLLTASVVRAAAKEIKLGIHVQLDWSMRNTEHPGFGRVPMKHTIKDLQEHGFVAFDDEIHINTQTSSQWDSLKHFGLQKEKLFYNGVTHDEAATSDVLGVHTICERGGIVGRAVLIDWVRWWRQTKPSEPLPAANTSHSIPISEIEQVARYQDVKLRQGDVLIVRSGYVAWYNAASAEDKTSNTRDDHTFIGIETNDETVRWLYDKHFSAVAGDTMGFEAWPPPKGRSLHEWLLVLWGTPIGELWNLEELSKTCEAVGRWSFFLISAPLNVPGGIGSPPCAIAIF